MSETTETPRPESFAAVISRARAKAEALRGNSPTPGEAPSTALPLALRDDPDLLAYVGRVCNSVSRDPSPAPPETAPAGEHSAALTRIGWYIPPRHERDTFEGFRPQNASQRVALSAAQRWVDAAAAERGPTLALVGGVGTGKSHLLYAAVRELNLRGVHCGAWGWYEIAAALREAKVARDGYAGAVVQRDRLHAARAVAIDEIRPTSGTEFDSTELSQLMTRAYRQMQAVIVTSNYADAKLAAILGRAATSRLTQVQVTGGDYRQRALTADAAHLAEVA